MLRGILVGPDTTSLSGLGAPRGSGGSVGIAIFRRFLLGNSELVHRGGSSHDRSPSVRSVTRVIKADAAGDARCQCMSHGGCELSS